MFLEKERKLIWGKLTGDETEWTRIRRKKHKLVEKEDLQMDNYIISVPCSSTFVVPPGLPVTGAVAVKGLWETSSGGG